MMSEICFSFLVNGSGIIMFGRVQLISSEMPSSFFPQRCLGIRLAFLIELSLKIIQCRKAEMD